MNLRIDKAELRRACADLRVPEPQVVISPSEVNHSDGSRTLADYDHRGIVTIYAGSIRPGGNLRQTLNTFNSDFLHELRHHWQRTHHPDWFRDKTGGYWNSKVEVDARDYAAQKMTVYRIIKIAPRKVTSSLSRLSQAEQRAR